jgi:predicted enzyme related to lactoylglutathione lyase
MAGNPVNWFEIYVQDMERAKRFYEAVLQTKLSRLPSPQIEMWMFPGSPEARGATGSLVHMPGFPSGGNSVLVYFACDDCATEGARVAKAGGRIQRDKTSIGEYGFIVLAYDTEGNMFGLHSTK